METIKEQTIAEKISEIVLSVNHIGRGGGGYVHALIKVKTTTDSTIQPDYITKWLLKVGHGFYEDICSNNKLPENLSLKLNNAVTLAVNDEVYFLENEAFNNISIIKFVENQKEPKIGQKKIKDFPQSAFNVLVGQMMCAIKKGRYPDLVGLGNILVNYEKESFQLIDSFYNYELADIIYSRRETNYFDALYKQLKILNGGEDSRGEIWVKLNEAIEYMGFTQCNGPYPYDAIIESVIHYGDDILYLNLQFPSLQEVEPEIVSQLLPSISFSKPFSVLEKQLEILDKIIPPYPVCRLASVLPCSLEDNPEPMSQQHNTR